MTTFTPNGHSQPLVAAYLADLDRALVGTHPQEREDIVTAVREHIEEALGSEGRDRAAKEVLTALGPVERIAASATPAIEPATPAADSDWLSRSLLVYAVVSVTLVVVLPWVAVPVAAGTLIAAIVQIRRETGRRGVVYASMALSVTTLLVAALMGLALVPADTQVFNDDVQVVQPNNG